MQRQNGFTLVELITVMVIIGLISAVAIPRFFDTQRFENRGFYTEVINAVRYAQQLAVAINCNTQVALTNNSYTITIDNDPTTCDDGLSGITDAPDPVTGQPGFTGSSTSVTDMTATTFQFSALGEPSIPTTTITVGGNNFRINGITGYIEEL